MYSAFGVQHTVEKAYGKNAARFKQAFKRYPGRNMGDRMKWNYSLYRGGAGEVGAKGHPGAQGIEHAREYKAWAKAQVTGSNNANRRRKKVLP